MVNYLVVVMSPLLSLCISFNQFKASSELVRNYRLVSPLAIALMVEGGWYDVNMKLLVCGLQVL